MRVLWLGFAMLLCIKSLMVMFAAYNIVLLMHQMSPKAHMGPEIRNTDNGTTHGPSKWARRRLWSLGRRFGESKLLYLYEQTPGAKSDPKTISGASESTLEGSDRTQDLFGNFPGGQNGAKMGRLFPYWQTLGAKSDPMRFLEARKPFPRVKSSAYQLQS